MFASHGDGARRMVRNNKQYWKPDVGRQADGSSVRVVSRRAEAHRVPARVVRFLRRFARQCPVRRWYDNIMCGRWPLAVLRTPTAWPLSELYRYAIVSPSIYPLPPPDGQTRARVSRSALRSVSFNILLLLFIVVFIIIIILSLL